MNNMKMVDLIGQTAEIRKEIDEAISSVIDKGNFIGGNTLKKFEKNLSKFMGGCHVVSCANGTDALQIALMALDLEQGDEILLPSFTYVATAEVVAVLGFTPVMMDVCENTFNMSMKSASSLITEKSKVIVPVHLYGQCADMESILAFANKHNLYVVEDCAQAIGAVYTFSDGIEKMAGTMGDIGTTSFFPSKNLGCFGDGGAMFTSNNDLVERLRMIANHGQKTKYEHLVVGVNSRLDMIQAAILDVKLRYLNSYISKRRIAADYYNENLHGIDKIILPSLNEKSTHVYHQYTLRILGKGTREKMKSFLNENGVPSMIYYPIPLHKQEAYMEYWNEKTQLSSSELLANQVLSLPMHTELNEETLEYIVRTIKLFFEHEH